MKQNLPAGIEGPGIEIYRNDKFQVFFLQDGTKKPFRELPADVLDLLREELNHDPIAKAALLKLISTNDDDLLLEMFAGCRYGNLDYTPDFVSGKLNREVPSCPLVKTCSGFSKVCQLPKTKDGDITRIEYFTAVCIARGLQAKEIADVQCKAEATVRTHTQRLHSKVGVNNNIELAAWANKIKLI